VGSGAEAGAGGAARPPFALARLTSLETRMAGRERRMLSVSRVLERLMRVYTWL
jgi:hypothetical protein